jgi:hypothetical protein
MTKIRYPQWPKKGDLAYFDKEEYVLVLDIATAKAVYTGMYEVDEDDGHIWLGGDNVIGHNDILAQVMSMNGYEWIAVERLFPVSE